MRRRLTDLGAGLAVALMLGACAGSDTLAEDRSAPEATTGADDGGRSEGGNRAVGGAQRHPDVVEAELEPTGDTWRLSATLSSPYDTPERYADSFRALTPDGEELGTRELLHDHADEQPFTRSLDGLTIPEGVGEIVVEGHDLEHGWGGATVTVTVPRAR